MIVLKYISDVYDCVALSGLPVLFKEKPASLVTGEGMSFDIKINQPLVVMDTDSIGVFAQETEILLCDSFFEIYSGYKMLNFDL